MTTTYLLRVLNNKKGQIAILFYLDVFTQCSEYVKKAVLYLLTLFLLKNDVFSHRFTFIEI